MERHGASPCIFHSPDPETTFALAAQLGRSIGARGLAIGLIGPLGAGKTVFVKGLAEGLGVDPRVVSSPTFVIAQEYVVPEGPEALHHLDFYRLESVAELESIGFADALRPGLVLAVEWLDRFPEALGEERLEVELLPPEERAEEAVDTGRRRIRATAFGDEPARVLRDWSERWATLERSRGGARGGGAGRGDALLALVLVVSGLIGLRAATGEGDGPGAGCAALAPVTALDHTSHGGAGEPGDELGPLRVVCAELDDLDSAPRPRAGAGRLTGMARLLDGGPVDPNTASGRLLESLPGIGPARAEAIMRERARQPFASTRALERVPGIGPRTREQLEPFLAVDPEADAG